LVLAGEDQAPGAASGHLDRLLAPGRLADSQLERRDHVRHRPIVETHLTARDFGCLDPVTARKGRGQVERARPARVDLDYGLLAGNNNDSALRNRADL